MAKRKKTDSSVGIVDATSPFGEHPIMTEILKATAALTS